MSEKASVEYHDEATKIPQGYEKVNQPLRKGWRDGIVKREVKDEQPS